MLQTSQITLYLSIFGVFLATLGLISTLLTASRQRKMEANMKVLFGGNEAKDLESILLAHAGQITELDTEIQELFEILNKVHALTFRSIHKVGIIRFNPFKDIGGDQSFAVALLDGKDAGIVISSLHTREGTRIYSKPITKGASEKYTLTEEEKQAIKSAQTIKPVKL